MRAWICLTLLLPLTLPATSVADDVSQADLLRRLIDVNHLVTPPPAGERTRMFSSYDRRSRIDGDGNYVNWDANYDRAQYLRQTDDGWDVMADVTGPGAITRLWSANPNGDIRFILDGDVVIDTTFQRLMSGQLEPFTAPLVFRGLNHYFPIGFSESGLVLCRDSDSYYQINVVEFPDDTSVQRFRFELDEAAQTTLAEVHETFENGLTRQQRFGDKRPMPVAVFEALAGGDTLSETVDGAGTIRALCVALTERADPREPYALHQCVLRVYFDGEDEPSIDAPLIDFFGSGFDLVRYNSLAAGTNRALQIPLPDRQPGEDRFMYCYFPMPYQRGVRIEIENLTDSRKDIGLLLYMEVDTRRPDRKALRFHARFRKEDPCEVFDYPILEAAGPGRIVGCLLNVDCPRRQWWGEGDEKIWIDGETFPSYFGTGTEDYLDDAWGLHEFIAPVAGVTRAGPFGKNSAYRWHIADVINFQRDVRFTLENWQHGGAKDTYYASIVYWYARPGSEHFFDDPIALADVTPPGLRIPGAIEIEDHILSTGWGGLMKEKYADAELSGQRAANIYTEEPVEMVIPSDAEQVAHLKLRVNPARSFERIEVRNADGRLIGTVDYARHEDGLYDVGIIKLEKGNNPLSVLCTRRSVLDCWILEPVPRINRGPEGEDLTVITPHIDTRVEYGTLDFSAGGQLVLEFQQPGQIVELELPERPDAEVVALRFHITTGPNYGRVQALLNGNPLGDPIECYDGILARKRVYLGSVPLGTGVPRLAFRALEPDRNAQGHLFGLDAVEWLPAAGPHALECEHLVVDAHHGSHHGVQPIGGASGGEHIWCQATEPGAWIELNLPVGAPGKYRLTAVYTRSFDYGIVQASVKGALAGPATDTYAKEIIPGLRVDLGTFELLAGDVPVRFEVVGQSDRSPGYFCGLDAILLEPVR